MSPVICPYCEHHDSKVIDSRSSEGGRVIRRRRECFKCAKRFTTYERVEQTSRLMVVKRDGRRMPFSAEKVLSGIQAACGKRPVSEEAKRRIVDEVEDEINREFEREVPSLAIGEKVMRRLRELDEVAYIRFASEYHQHRDAGDVLQEARAVTERVKDVKDQKGLFEGPEKRGGGVAAPS